MSHGVYGTDASGREIRDLGRSAQGDQDPRAAIGSSLHLVVRGLACRRGERRLFEDLDLDLAAGELVWLRAANGYGKTTLLRVLAGLARSDAGTIEWHHGDVASGGRPDSLLFLAHTNALKDDLTVAESVRLMVSLHGLAAGDRAVAAAIDRFGLHGRRDAPIRTLSQGQRRRVALTRLALSDPRATWILDEPYDALDVDGVALVSTLLAEHAAGGGNVLFTSHVSPVLVGVTARIVALDERRPARQAAEAP